MSNPKSRNTDFTPWGLSPKGGNAKEVASSQGTAMAPVRETEVQGVPLYKDPLSGAFVSKLAIQEQEDREAAINLAEKWNDDEEFRNQAGFRRS